MSAELLAHPLDQGLAPHWAISWGQDEWGVWAAFEVEGVESRLRWLPPGRFLMGSPASEKGRWEDEGPQHEATLTSGFWCAETACTEELWSAVVGSRVAGDPALPVVQVSWEDCQELLARCNRLVPGLELRLPSEAEWEYACRAGTATAYSWGEKPEPKRARYGGRRGRAPVRSHPPNPWGLYEMHGNVWEWCQDWFGDYPEEECLDPTGPASGRARVYRGGAWAHRARLVRSACRYWVHPGLRYVYLGFRVARGPE